MALRIERPGPEGRIAKYWKWDPVHRCLDNKLYGVRYQIVDMVKENGDLAYEAVVLLSSRIELHVVVRKQDGAIAFVRHVRERVIQLDAVEKFFRDHPGEVIDIFDQPCGIEELELPTGIAKVPLEEVEQEVGMKVIASEHIGWVKESPPLGGVPQQFYAVMVDGTPSDQKPEEFEDIKEVVFVPPEEVRNIETICALTQAGLWRFRCWALRKPGTIWHSVAMRL